MKSLRMSLFALAAMLVASGAMADDGALKRVDCRFHDPENAVSVNHCYASATYRLHEWGIDEVNFGVACDFQTIYNDSGRIHPEEVSVRISPPTAAFPAVQIMSPHALTVNGTYTSKLDIREGELEGTCYVHDFY